MTAAMPNPFDTSRERRHGRHRHHRHHDHAPAIEVQSDPVVLGIWIALFVLFLIGAVSALLR